MASSASDACYYVPSIIKNIIFISCLTVKRRYVTPSSSNMRKPQNSDVRLASESWLASAFSTMLNSVPNSPAVALENAFIRRTLERVSSFRTGQNIIHGPNTTIGRWALSYSRKKGRPQWWDPFSCHSLLDWVVYSGF
ncbi:unnamed protein product [Musa textilis]